MPRRIEGPKFKRQVVEGGKVELEVALLVPAPYKVERQCEIFSGFIVTVEISHFSRIGVK